ncbi:MAG: hypothetical protein ACOYON_01345 [Fimbriimonas sp.]
MLSILAATVALPALAFQERWVYIQTNLAVGANVDRLLPMLDRAKKAGYNGIVLTDSKFAILEKMTPSYFENAAKLAAHAKALGLTITPVVAEMGWSSGLLSHNVNLIEGQPAKKVPFEVRGGTLQPVAEVVHPNPGLENFNGDKVDDAAYQDGPGVSSFSDSAVVHSGSRSLRYENFRADSGSGNARLMIPLKVRPYQPYRVSFWLKTEGVEGAESNLRCFAMGSDGKILSFMDVGAAPTQAWKQHTIIFNSQASDKVTLYTGLWSGTKGKFWLDDFRVEEAGFLNVLRRPKSLPKIELANGTVLTEGKDYEVVEDPNLGQKPWAGEYTFDQAAPKIKVVPGRLSEGTKVLATYVHAVATETGKTAICPSEPQTLAILADQFQRVSTLWSASGMFFGHDEIRVANQCPTCTARGLSPGGLYAADLRQCQNLGRGVLRDGNMYVWSDMFDPFHNAKDDYYLSNGTWKESWKGLSPSTVVVNWNSGSARDSLQFFSALGCRQIIAGYYDAPVSEFQKWKTAMKDVKGVTGVMYTTWIGDYSKLEEFAKAAF